MNDIMHNESIINARYQEKRPCFRWKLIKQCKENKEVWLAGRLTFSVRMPRVLSSALADRSLAARDKRSV